GSEREQHRLLDPRRFVRIGGADHQLDSHILNLVLVAVLVLAGSPLPAHKLLAQLEQVSPVDLDQPRTMLLAHLTLPLALSPDILRPAADSPQTSGTSSR